MTPAERKVRLTDRLGKTQYSLTFTWPLTSKENAVIERFDGRKLTIIHFPSSMVSKLTRAARICTLEDQIQAEKGEL